MQELITFFSNLQNLEELIRWGGYTVLACIVFAESGLFFGFFLPGDSLLVTAGLLASRGYLNIWELFFLLALMAIAGDSVGYYFGKITGPKLFTRQKSWLFAKDHLLKAKAYYEHHGGKTIIFARFIPIIRTFAPIVAGVGQMEYRRFLSFNIFGGLGWVALTLGLGFTLGRTFPNIDRYMHLVIAAIVLVSLLPPFVSWLKSRNKS